MYDAILSRSFSKNEQKKLGNCAFLVCLVVALSLCTVFRPQFHQSVLNLRLSTASDLVIGDEGLLSPVSTQNYTLPVLQADQQQQQEPPAVGRITDKETEELPTIFRPLATSQPPLPSRTTDLEPHAVVPPTGILIHHNEFQPLATSQPPLPSRTADLEPRAVVPPTGILIHHNEFQPLATSQPPLPSRTADLESHAVVRPTDAIEPNISQRMASSLPDHLSQTPKQQEPLVPVQPIGTETMDMKPICNVSEPLSDYCDIDGNIRVLGNASTILVASSPKIVGNNSWSIKPYARKGNEDAMNYVREWRVKVIEEARENVPSCTKYHTTPAILFSAGGYSGNHFHGFSDVLIPLFSNSRIFKGKVHFLATNYKTWWISKFGRIFDKLSEHEVIDIDREEGIHCYQRVIIGLKSHKELGIDKSKSPDGFSMKDFREFLRTTYSLERQRATKFRNADNDKKPRLMIISRANSRKLLNEGKISKMAQKLGYEVVVAEAGVSTNVSRYAQVVNSCDVLMGVHGAGLTNMVFLPDNAVVIQVVPLGGIDGFANDDFGEPSKDMNIRYLSYKIEVKESSLIKQYPVDHQVIQDPFSFHKQGWNAIRTTYLDNQNVILDVRRFRSTLIKALKLLHH